MGSFSRGIHGGFSGKVGNVVGAHWRGIDYIRSLPRVSKGRPVTEEQLMHRVRFVSGGRSGAAIGALVSFAVSWVLQRVVDRKR